MSSIEKFYPARWTLISPEEIKLPRTITFIRLYRINYKYWDTFPVSILHKSIAGRYRPVRVADGPITTRYRFM